MSKPVPPCPICRTPKQVQAIGFTGETFRCGRCGGFFDNDPDEGGTFSNFNPAARLERAERKRGR